MSTKPGQYVLSGSVRFTSKKSIRESLAGRMATLEMLPFSVAEIMGDPLSDVASLLLGHRQFSLDSVRCLNDRKLADARSMHFGTYLENGGLPGLCFIRDRALQRSALGDLHDLMLGRDLPMIAEVRSPVATVKKLLSFIAASGLEVYSAAQARRVTGLAPQTQKRIIDAMESIFLLRRISVRGRAKECLLLEDQLEERIYAGSRIGIKARLETAVYRDIRTQFFYRLGKDVVFETYLTRDGARVPLVITGGEQSLGIIVHEDEAPSLSERRSAASLLRSDGSAKVIYLSAKSIAPRIIDNRTMACSIAAIL